MKDISSIFWKKWIAADSIDREELVKKLKITHQLAKSCPKADMVSSLDTAALFLNSYFEDLEEALYSLESSRKKRKS